MPEQIAILDRYSMGEAPTKKHASNFRTELLDARAARCAGSMVWLPRVKSSPHFSQRLRRLKQTLHGVFATIESAAFAGYDGHWLRENLGFLRSALASVEEAETALTETAHVRCSGNASPRVLVIAEDLLASLDYRFGDSEFTTYLHAFQSTVVLRLDELRALVPALQCVLLERIASLANLIIQAKAASGLRVVTGSQLTVAETCIHSLHEIEQAPWQELLEPLIAFDTVLRRDPAGAYADMDAESKEMYRSTVVRLANRSELSELEIAELALSLAQESQRVPEDDPVLAQRRAHVGYYLMAEGQEQLHRRAHGRCPLRERLQRFLRRYPNEFYLGGIELLTFSMIVAALLWGDFNSLWTAFGGALVLLLPCSEAAGQIMNYLTSSLLQPQALPKLDFRRGIPDDCTTMVVVPTLLLNEKQVRQLAYDLEVRYLGNMSANLHFALLTDLPDSDEQPREDDPMVELCGQLIRELNQKYEGNGAGAFAMFHRHRVYNRGEGVWMGWERKRGKLLDFNRLVLGQYDSFPYKVGDLSVLPGVRYVLTVDADTELPRGTAEKLIGTLAHPLCRPIVDRNNVVVQGFGILQPRIAISVESAAQSRLASIYSGRTGFDIYTHATSDVYQDLYGEGTFVGKGLYDLRVVHRVLDRRFPRNAILSHDLIEGAYARAGLVSDVEVIDRYPSHYSAYCRRRHRWVRGDWQIVDWLFPRVPDESGRRVPNLTSLVSRWKIVDNLRRSMVGPATLVLFILGWLVLPGQPLYWTMVSLSILLLPSCLQCTVALARAGFARSLTRVRDACESLATALAGDLLRLALLIHDALLSVDAIVRSLYRRTVSRQRLLEWESAAEAELEIRKRTSLDLYLARTPVIALGIGTALLLARPSAFWAAWPILMLWAGSKKLSVWLDQPPHPVHNTVAAADKLFLRLAALRTWRYFAEFSNSEHHWLIPDNVQEEPAKHAARISPTNLGFLLNARQMACELGYLTVPEFAEQTRRTIETMRRLQRHRGHFFNWYSTRTLSPEAPLFISSVDSGNLAASLIALKVGCSALLEKPLLSPSLVEGYEDHLRLLAESNSVPCGELNGFREGENDLPWLERLAGLVSEPVTPSLAGSGTAWPGTQPQLRRQRMQEIFTDYMPWLLPEFESTRRRLGIDPGTEGGPALLELPALAQQLEARLSKDAAEVPGSDSEREQRDRLLALLPGAYERVSSLVRELHALAAKAERWVAEMDFGFLLEGRRKLLSVGYRSDTGTLSSACYDLLASEARIAAFIAIAKGDVPQDTWLRMGRAPAPARGGSPVLISWAGTMFEYLMPAIWMRSPCKSLLRQSMQGAVRAQRAYAASKQVPWGISESGYADVDEAGMYCYAATGVPELALRDGAPERLVVAPYACGLALAVASADAIDNLRRMADLGWLHTYGFYESADFGAAENRAHDPSVVRAWMAHHQGMILLSIGNLLCGNIMQQWFHSDARVRATELLLHERPALMHARAGWRLRRTAKPVHIVQERSGDELAMAS